MQLETITAEKKIAGGDEVKQGGGRRLHGGRVFKLRPYTAVHNAPFLMASFFETGLFGTGTHVLMLPHFISYILQIV